MQYFLSFLKTLALRVKPDSMHLLIRGDDYPLMRRAVKLAGHSDQMVRTQARAAYLTLLRCAKDGHVLDQAIEVTLEMLLVAFGNVWLSDVGCALNKNIVHVFDQFDQFAWFGNALQKEISSNGAKPNSVGVLSWHMKVRLPELLGKLLWSQWSAMAQAGAFALFSQP